MHSSFKNVHAIAEAIERLLFPFAEVVIHNIKTDKIVAIYNAFSKRKIGDPSLLSKEDKMFNLDHSAPYEKVNVDGRKLKSISSVIRDDKNNAVGLFCVNLDISKLETCKSLIDNFINCESLISQPTALFKNDWQERINQYTHAYLNKNHLNLDTLSKLEKQKVVQHLNEMGAFTGKNTASYIAQLLKVSRATVYNYLV